MSNQAPRMLAAPELEVAVLGSVLQDALVLERLKAVLMPEDFADTKHQHVYRAMLELCHAGTPVDHLTVSERLKSNGTLSAVGGPAFLMDLDAQVPLATRAPEYALQVRSLSIRRNAVKAAQEAARKAADLSLDVDTVLTDGARSWASLTHSVKGVRNGRDYVLDLLDDLDKVQRGEVEPAVPTGIDRWDEVFGGLQPGKLTFLGSLPGVGKSSVIASMVENLCGIGRKVGFFSLEDLGRWLPRRILSKRAGIPLFVLSMRALGHHQMERVGEVSPAVHDLLGNLEMDERSMLTPAQLVQTAREMVINRGVEVIIIDHLGKLNFESGKFHGHDLAIEHGLNEITAFAKDHNIPVLIAAHLKEREKDAKYQRPDLESFARTAYIGRDARVAVGLYLEKDDEDVLNVAVLKQTEGEGTGDFQLRRLKESGMVASRNGAMKSDSYARAEARMKAEVGHG
jgi:replicative DNA helicase